MIKDKLEEMVLAWGTNKTTGEVGFGIHTMEKELIYKTHTVRIRGELYNRVYLSQQVIHFISKARTKCYNHVTLEIESTANQNSHGVQRHPL